MEDGSSECNAVYDSITDQANLSELLNRVNGNFLTNFTRLKMHYIRARVIDGFQPMRMRPQKNRSPPKVKSGQTLNKVSKQNQV